MDPLHRERLVQIKSGGVPAEPHEESEEAAPASAPRPSVAREPIGPEPEERLSPFTPEEVHALRERWAAAQSSFVEAPQRAVEQADQLVGEVLDRLAGAVDEERAALRPAYHEPEPSTEELRLAMRRYHALLDRLLEPWL